MKYLKNFIFFELIPYSLLYWNLKQEFWC